MFRKLLLGSIVFLSGCGSIVNSGQEMMGDTDFHKIKFNDKEFFFQYPKRAVVVDDPGYVDLSYIPGCGRVYFGDYSVSGMGKMKAQNAFEVSSKKSGNKAMEVWYKDGFPVFDLVTYSDNGGSFWLYNDKKDVSPCMETFNFIVNSFTDEPRYKNDEFSFSVRIPELYKVTELPSGDGLILKKTIQTQDPKLPVYDVNITFIAFDNLKNYENIADYVGERYAGYTVRFKDYGEFSGFFVDESTNVTGMAISHFFTLGKSKDAIYQADLQLPSKFYNTHGAGFEGLVAGLKFY